MSSLFWWLTAFGYVSGLGMAWLVSRRLIIRIAEHADDLAPVRRGGLLGGIIATPPALLLATMLGGNLGGAVAAHLIEDLSSDAGVRQAAVGAGIGIGGCVLLVVLIGGMTAAGASFARVLSAGKQPPG